MTELFEFDQLFFDSVNAMICVAFFVFANRKKHIPSPYIYFIPMTAIVPFFLNGVLFPPELMSDQFKYLDAAQIWRSLDFSIPLVDQYNYRITNASLIFSIIPIPAFENVRSLGFASKLIFFLIVIIIAKKGHFSKPSLIFLCFFPSAILYSSLGLRDTQVLFFMIISFVFLIEKKTSLAYLLSIPLFFIKFQNFYIQIIFLTLYWVFSVGDKGISIARCAFIFITGYIIFAIAFPYFIDEINFFRLAMFIEDGGDPRDIREIGGRGDFLYQGALDGAYFLLKPFPWEAENVLQLFQSIENIGILLFLVWFVRDCFKKTPDRIAFWVLYIITSCVIYGLVVTNFGTSARYKFPIILTFVILAGSECQQRMARPRNVTARYKNKKVRKV